MVYLGPMNNFVNFVAKPPREIYTKINSYQRGQNDKLRHFRTFCQRILG